MNFFQLLTGSFYSADAYRYMRARATGGMGYALFLVTFVSCFVVLYFGIVLGVALFADHAGAPPLFDTVIHQIAEQTPVMTLKNDTLVTKEAKKTVIRISGSYGTFSYDEPIITLDTTGDSTIENTTTAVLVTSKDVFVRSGNAGQQKWEAHPLSEFTKDGPETVIINHAAAEAMATTFVSYIHGHLATIFTLFFLVCWFVAILVMFVVNFFYLMLLGVIGIVIGALTKGAPLSFGAALSLASLSFTPVVLLDAVLLATVDYAAHSITILLAGAVTLYAAVRCSEPATMVTAA